MRTIRLLPGTLVAALLLAGCNDAPPATARASTDTPATRHFGAIAFEPCSLPSVAGGPNTEALCATFRVPENPAAPNGRRIGLNMAWLPVAKGGATGDPVFFLAGGPGQAATEHAATVNTILREVRKQRDVILVDQRGTGKSNPLSCLDKTGKELPVEALDAADPAALAGYARQCAQSLATRADPRFYTTTEAVRDLEAVRAALGVDSLNLVGVSYGTRLAQQYAGKYPQRARSIVLDGVVPNDLVVGGEFAHTFENALALQSAQCQKLPACRQRYASDLRAQLRNVMAKLSAAPVEVEYRDPATGESKRGTVTADTVTALAAMFSYAPQSAALLPLVIDEADQGRYGPLMSLAQLMSKSVGGQMNRGMQWSVICAEDANRYRDDATAADTVLGTQVARMMFAACQAWPTGKRPADFNAPFQSSVPTLLLSGELDPVTPPSYGERVAKGLGKGRHQILRGQAHNVSGIGCMPKLLGQFIETADAKALDMKCLDTLSYVPPFTSFNGWEP